MSATPQWEQILDRLFADLALIKRDQEKVAVGVVARDAASDRLAQAAGRVEASVALLKLWTLETDKRLDKQHETQIRVALESIAERMTKLPETSTGDVELSLPVGEGRIRLSANGAVVVRLVTVVGTAIAAWAVGAAHAAQHVVEQVSK